MKPTKQLAGALFVCWGVFGGTQQASRIVTRLPAGGDQQYEVSAGPCAKHKCEIAVSLVGGRPLDRRVLEMTTASPDFEKRALRHEDGFGNPTSSKLVNGWASGGDEDETTLAISSFHLAPGLTGILIDQRSGFESLKRRHVLLAAKNGKLIELWKGSEGAGPSYSTVGTIDAPGGRQALVFYSVFFSPENNAPDRLRIKSLIYDPAANRMIPHTTDLRGLTIGPFLTIASARAQRDKLKCADSLWVLPAKGFGGGSGYVLATVSAETASIPCAPGAKVSVFSIKKDKFDLW